MDDSNHIYGVHGIGMRGYRNMIYRDGNSSYRSKTIGKKFNLTLKRTDLRNKFITH